jgi:uncharacterized protein (UPF0333 family)
MKARNRKGQSTLEYIILITAVIAVMIYFLRIGDNSGTGGGILYNTVLDSYNQVSNGINVMTNKLTSSWNVL